MRQIVHVTAANATELFEQAKQLPVGEQDLLLDLLRRWRESGQADAAQSPPAGQQLVIPDYAARLREDFPDGGLKGDPQEFWDYVRAERF